MPKGLAILVSSAAVSVVHRRLIGGRTVIEIDAQMSSIWQRVHVHQVALRLFDLLPFESQLLFSESPELTLGRFPVVRGHVGECYRM